MLTDNVFEGTLENDLLPELYLKRDSIIGGVMVCGPKQIKLNTYNAFLNVFEGLKQSLKFLQQSFKIFTFATTTAKLAVSI